MLLLLLMAAVVAQELSGGFQFELHVDFLFVLRIAAHFFPATGVLELR